MSGPDVPASDGGAPSWHDVLLPPARRGQLRRRLAHVTASSERFRDLYAGVTVPDEIDYPSLASLPLVTKTDIIEAQRHQPPYGGFFIPGQRIARTTCSPGPEYLAWSRADWDGTAEAMGASFRDVAGVRADDTVDITLTYHWVPAGTLFNDAFDAIGCHSIPGGAGMSELHLDVIRDTGVTVVFGFTPFVEHLGERALELGRDPAGSTVRLLVIGGELRNAAAKARLSELWGAETVEFYGVAEMGMIALECPPGDGMHLDGRVVVEIIDPDTGEHTDAATGGEIVVTDLLREAMPLIRYRTGDITEGVNFDPCVCGSSVPRLGRILGRRSSMYRVKGMFLNPDQVTGVVTGYPDLGRFQIVINREKTTDSLSIEIEAATEEPPATRADDLAAALQRVIRLRPIVRFVTKGMLPADALLVADNRVL